MISCVWDPHLPSVNEMEVLHERIQEELEPFHEMLGLLSGFLSGDVE